MILGANGSGKTSLLRLLAGIVPPTSGSVLMDGVSIHAGAPLWPRVAVIFEEPDPQFLAETVEAEIAFGLESMALPAAETRTRVDEALQTHGLQPLAARDPRTLSAGEKIRTLLAAALAARPSALLLDQCFSHLDPAARRAAEARIAAEARAGRLGVLRSSQELDSAPGERLHWLEQGVLRDVLELTPAAVLAARAAPFPLALRVSAALAMEGRWSGPLAASVGDLLASLERIEPGAARRVDDGAALPGRSPAPPPASSSAVPLLQLRAVTWAPAAGAAPVVEDVSLEVGAGEVVALVGASGTGKSTLLHLAAGLRAPTAGAVERAQPAVKRTAGVMLALEYPERQLFARTVAEDVAASLWIEGRPAEERARRAAHALREVDLDPERFADRIPGTLSEGEKRRAALASFMIDPPLVLLWDEPTAGLDPEGRRALRGSLARLKDGGRAVLFASHDLDFVAGTADRVLVLGRESRTDAPGRLLGGGDPEHVCRDEALLSRAGLPLSEAVLVSRALRDRGWLPPARTPDADSLMAALQDRAVDRTGASR